MKTLRGIQSLPGNTTYNEMDSPVGTLTIITSPAGLHAILWEGDGSSLRHQEVVATFVRSKNEKTIVATQTQLTEYFQGERTVFDLPLVVSGTEFQQKVWQQLLKIPYGQTICYSEQATRIGDKNKARAVGMANGCNPIPIIVPCHRVIGKSGHLTGFAGGVDKKAYLLQLEKRTTVCKR